MSGSKRRSPPGSGRAGTGGKGRTLATPATAFAAAEKTRAELEGADGEEHSAGGPEGTLQDSADEGDSQAPADEAAADQSASPAPTDTPESDAPAPDAHAPEATAEH